MIFSCLETTLRLAINHRALCVVNSSIAQRVLGPLFDLQSLGGRLFSGRLLDIHLKEGPGCGSDWESIPQGAGHPQGHPSSFLKNLCAWTTH
ncbi:MAG: hypothetical protein EBS01_06660 [Verrucomicrobia bacterium]|nr:hypothetical protein [Verrucomicrobiota bacterium]